MILAASLVSAPAFADGLETAVDRYVAAMDDGSPWEASGALSIAVTSGNSDTVTVAAGLQASKMWDPWKLTLKLDSIYGRANGVENKNEHIFQERLERQLTPVSWLFQDLLLEHDAQENLNIRVQFTVGYRRQLVKKEKFELFGEIGGGVLYEEFRTKTETEGILHLGVDWKWQITDKLLYTQVIRVYPSLSEFGEFRLMTESVFTAPLSDRIDARLAILDRYDSAAGAGIKKNDLVVTFGLQIKLTKPKA